MNKAIYTLWTPSRQACDWNNSGSRVSILWRRKDHNWTAEVGQSLCCSTADHGLHQLIIQRTQPTPLWGPRRDTEHSTAGRMFTVKLHTNWCIISSNAQIHTRVYALRRGICLCRPEGVFLQQICLMFFVAFCCISTRQTLCAWCTVLHSTNKIWTVGSAVSWPQAYVGQHNMCHMKRLRWVR